MNREYKKMLLFIKTKFKISMIFILLSIISLSYAQDFSMEKVVDIYKADDYRKIVRNEEYIFTSGARALHLLTNDDNGNLITLDELPLWGHLALSIFSSIEIIGNYVYLFGLEIGSSFRTRLYRVSIENESLTLVDSINFYDDDQIRQVLGANEHLFVIPQYLSETLYIYDNDDFEVVAEYSIQSFFHNNELYKLNEQYLYTWDDDIDGLMHIFDVSDVCDIQEIAQIDFDEIFPDIPIGLPVMINDTTLVLCYPELYSFFDLSDISNWQLLSTIEFTGGSALNNLAVLNDERIIIPYGNGSVGLYDISDIEEPVLLSSQDYVRLYYLDGCVCFENNFYQVDSGFGIHQFRIVDDQFEYLGPFPEFTARRAAYIHNDLLAVRTFFWRGMHFFDMSDLNNIQYICTHFDNHFQYGCDFEDNYLAIPLVSFPEYIYNIDIYDISYIENPLLVNRIENILASDVYLEYPYLYSREAVPYSPDYHFVKYDISEPYNPQVIYDYELYPHMYGFFKYGNHIYYRGGEEIINILGNLDGDYPEVVETLEISGLNGFWPLNDGYLKIDQNSEIIKIYSLDNPLEPEFLFDYPYHWEIFFVGIEEDIFFQGSYSINVYDIENGYNINDPIYSFEMPYNTDIRYFFEEDEEDYVLFTSITGISLYKYDYDNTFIFKNEIYNNRISLSNHPNPFNPETKIVFNIPEEGNVKLEIYNIKGQRVKQLISNSANQLSAGQHTVVWDGRDDNRKRVSSGVYFYQLITEKKTIYKKMMLLK